MAVALLASRVRTESRTCPMVTRATVSYGFPKAPRIPVWRLGNKGRRRKSDVSFFWRKGGSLESESDLSELHLFINSSRRDRLMVGISMTSLFPTPILPSTLLLEISQLSTLSRLHRASQFQSQNHHSPHFSPPLSATSTPLQTASCLNSPIGSGT